MLGHKIDLMADYGGNVMAAAIVLSFNLSPSGQNDRHG